MMPTSPKNLRLAVLLSGSGTTLQNLLDLSASGDLPANVVVVISNKKGAYGLERARFAGVETAVIERKTCSGLEDFSSRIFNLCRDAQVDLVCLAGFMQLLKIPEDFTHRVLNVHPALIPAFCGKGFYGHHVHEAVLAYGVKVSGCTVHLADNQYDNGPIVLQKVVPVLEGDTPETLAERVQQAERKAYPEAIALFAEGRIRIEGRIVHVLPGRDR